MNSRVSEALREIDMTYNSLIELADDIYQDVAGDIDNLVNSIRDGVEGLSNDSIRTLMLRLSISSYRLSEIKEKSAFKASLGQAIREEAYAHNFNATEGTVANREKTATIQTSAEILAEEIHSLISSLFKTKLDEIHRLVQVLQTTLTTRVQEAKLIQNDIA